MPRQSNYEIPEDSAADVDPHIAVQKKYRATEKGKAAAKKDGASDSHARAQRKYFKSTKGKEAVARWRNSPQGKAFSKKLTEDKARARLMLARSEEGLCELCGESGHTMEAHVNGSL